MRAVERLTVRGKSDVRFLTSSTHEMYYVLKYFVKNQNTVDNRAALTLLSYTKNLDKVKELEDVKKRTQLVYGRIGLCPTLDQI